MYNSYDKYLGLLYKKVFWQLSICKALLFQPPTFKVTNKDIYLTVLVNFINTYLLKLALVQTNPKYFETLDLTIIIFNTRNKQYFSYPSHRLIFFKCPYYMGIKLMVKLPTSGPHTNFFFPKCFKYCPESESDSCLLELTVYMAGCVSVWPREELGAWHQLRVGVSANRITLIRA